MDLFCFQTSLLGHGHMTNDRKMKLTKGLERWLLAIFFKLSPGELLSLDNIKMIESDDDVSVFA